VLHLVWLWSYPIILDSVVKYGQEKRHSSVFKKSVNCRQKHFITLAPGVNVIKHFSLFLTLHANKLVFVLAKLVRLVLISEQGKEPRGCVS
jgi:hypothetical protein